MCIIRDHYGLVLSTQDGGELAVKYMRDKKNYSNNLNIKAM